MIYKISLVAAALAAVASFYVSNKFRSEAQQASLQLNESRDALAAVQKIEKGTEVELKQIIEENGGITEVEFIEMEKTLQTKAEEADAARKAAVSALNESNAQEHRLRTSISELKYSNDVLEKDIAKLKEELKRKRISDTASNPKLKPFSTEHVSRIIDSCMTRICPENANMEHIRSFYCDPSYILHSHTMWIPAEDMLEATKEIIRNYSDRGHKFIAAGTKKKENLIQVIIGYVYMGAQSNDPYVKDRTGYTKYTFLIDEKGLIFGLEDLDSTVSEGRPKLDKGFVPFKYNGKTSISSQAVLSEKQ